METEGERQRQRERDRDREGHRHKGEKGGGTGRARGEKDIAGRKWAQGQGESMGTQAQGGEGSGGELTVKCS